MEDMRVPLSDLIVDRAMRKVMSLWRDMESDRLEEFFLGVYEALHDAGKIHVIDADISPLRKVVGIDGGYALYKMFGGGVGVYATIAAVFEDGMVIPRAIRYGADAFMGERDEKLFQVREYTQELETILDVVNDMGDVPLFVDGSLSSSMGHLHTFGKVNSKEISDMVRAVEDVLNAVNIEGRQISFVPKRMVKTVAFEDADVKDALEKKGLLSSRYMNLAEPLTVGYAMLKKRAQWRQKKDRRALMPMVAGPFSLVIDLDMKGIRVFDTMNTYYINLWQWRHSAVRVDVGNSRDITFIKEMVLPALDLAPRVACIMAADEYAKSVVSSAINNFLDTLRSSPQFSDILKILPDYRGEGSMDHSVFFGE